ncbi:hypothetical protein [Vreelandella subglaciescola]|uniref:Uncharacterized protein n=1 Tax=Vreelandella subglaciescola TaxID=29571 RepID=A0A1M7GLK8_9GAMM|nr:hypothetical protein [Halomonas subglaciescola]SHM16769.1 hypothetical protein SAMN05878437_1582 [Halomonas subglaciescola]
MKDSPSNLDGFLNGASKKPEVEAAPSRPEPKVQKNFRVRRSIAEELTREALEESIRTGVRVTQEGIVEAILEERYKDR